MEACWWGGCWVWGAFPHIHICILIYSRHLICFSTETFRFYGKGRISSSWKRLSSYVKGLLAPCVVFGTLANIPWTVLHTCYYKEIYPELYPAPSIPLISKVLLVLAIISMYFWTLCYLTYVSAYSVDPKLSTVLFSTGKMFVLEISDGNAPCK